MPLEQPHVIMPGQDGQWNCHWLLITLHLVLKDWSDSTVPCDASCWVVIAGKNSRLQRARQL